MIQIYSNDMQDIYENITDYNPNRKCRIFIIFNDRIADKNNNKNVKSVVKSINFISIDLFIRCRKLNASLVFITQSYFWVPKNVRRISTRFVINISINRWSDFDLKDFMKIHKNPLQFDNNS